MANRFWVGGTGNLDGTTTRWSATSGGAGGASFPGTSDVAIFDANSGGGTITMTTDLNINSFRFDGVGAGAFAGTFNQNGQTIIIRASSTISSGMTFQHGFGAIGTLGSATITTNGKTLGTLECGGGTLTLGDDLTCAGTLGLATTGGITLNTNGKAVSCVAMYGTSTTGTLTLGASVITITATGPAVFDSFGSMTINANTSTLKFTGAAPEVNLGGKTWATIWCANGNGNKTRFVTSNGTIGTLKVDPGVEVDFLNGVTFTINAFDMTGTAGQRIKLRSESSGSTYTLSKASGTVSITQCDIKDCVASGGATFNAISSVNSGNNSGWTFLNFNGFTPGPRLSYLRR